MLETVAFGGAAALIWGATALTSAPASRLAGPWRAMFWMSLAATAATALVALSTGLPAGSASDWTLVAVAGLAYTASTACWLSTVRGGDISLVTPIIACDGAIAALLAVVAGESLSALAAAALAAMVLAVLLIAREEAAPPVASEVRFRVTVERSTRKTVFLAFLTALFFAIVFFTSGKIHSISPLWVVAAARTIPCVYAFLICAREGSMAGLLAGLGRRVRLTDSVTMELSVVKPSMRRNASRNSAAVWKRSSGGLASDFMIAALNMTGTAGFTVAGGAGVKLR